MEVRRLLGLGPARIGAASVVVAGVLAATFGAGYTITRAMANDDSAWMRKGVTIVHMNGPSGRYDATVGTKPASLAAAVSDPLELVQESNGDVYTVDTVTHKVFRIDTDTMSPQPGPPGTSVLAQGSNVFVVNAESRTVTAVNPKTLSPKKSVAIPAPISSDAITSAGDVVIGEKNGAVSFVTPAGHVSTTHLPGAEASVTVAVAGAQPAAIEASTDRLYVLGPNGSAGQSIHLLGPAGSPVQVTANQPSGPLWLVQGTQLEEASLTSGQTEQVSLPSGGSYDAPVPANGRVYVPDTATSQVLVYNASTLAAEPTIQVPAGVAGDHQIEVAVNDGRVWIDNPSSSLGESVAPNGQVETINKGTGDGVVSPAATSKSGKRAPSPATTRTRATAPTRKAAASPAVAPLPVTPPQSVTQPPVTSSVAPTALPAQPATTPVNHSLPVTGSPSSPGNGSGNPSGQGNGVVPSDLVGQTGQEACAEIQQENLTCALGYIASPTTRPGIVVKVSPAGGSKLHAGKTVTVYENEVAVPSYKAGTNYATYCEEVDAAGLTCSPHDDGQGPAGSTPQAVTKVTPKVGTLVVPQSSVTVDYYDSKATSTTAPSTPPSSTSPGSTEPSVPNVVGQNESSACSALAAAGFTCSETFEQASGSTPNQVVGQSPAGGTPAAAGSTVTVDVDDEAVPSPTAGESYTDYCSSVQTLGLGCAPSDQGADPHPGDTPNVATGVSPAPGSLAQPGSTVTVTYYDSVPQLVKLYEWKATTETGSNGKQIDPNIHAITTTDSAPPTNTKYYESWSQIGDFDDYGYQLLPGGSCPTGTTPLYQWTYGSQTGSAKYEHFYYSPNSAITGPWGNQTTIACVYPAGTSVANGATVYEELSTTQIDGVNDCAWSLIETSWTPVWEEVSG